MVAFVRIVIMFIAVQVGEEASDDDVVQMVCARSSYNSSVSKNASVFPVPTLNRPVRTQTIYILYDDVALYGLVPEAGEALPMT